MKNRLNRLYEKVMRESYLKVRKTTGIIGISFGPDKITGKSFKQGANLGTFYFTYEDSEDKSTNKSVIDSNGNKITIQASNGKGTIKYVLKNGSDYFKTKNDAYQLQDIVYYKGEHNKGTPIVQLHSVTSAKILTVELLTGTSIIK